MRNHINSLMQKKNKLFGVSLRDISLSFGPFALLLLISLVVAYYYIDPAPPHSIVISVGQENSDFLEYASSYQEILARDNITLEIRRTAGALESLHHLEDNHSGVDVAFVFDGLHTSQEANIYSLGSINYEPVWVFYHGNRNHKRLADFTGKRIAIGKEGGGTQVFAKRLLSASGIGKDNTVLVSSGREEAVALLEKEQVDAIFLMGQPDSALIKSLLTNARVHALDFDQAEAYSRQFPFLHHLVLPHGIIDLHNNIPATDLHLLATTSILAVRDVLHPAIISLLMKAMTEVHDAPGLLHKEHTFPEDKDIDFDLSPDAQRFYKSGPPILQRYLPFWLATLIDRVLIVAIPLFALLIPLTKTIPLIYRWLVKRRINRWYVELLYLETQIRVDSNYDVCLHKLVWLEEQVDNMKIPLVFLEYSYVLKEHIELVRKKLLRYKNGSHEGEPLTDQRQEING